MAEWLRRHLVADARSFWRWYSTWGLGAIASLGVLWEMLPALQQYLPPGVVTVLAVAAVVGRVVDQKK